MAIRLGGKKITSMYLGGKKVKEAWLKGEKVWPEDNDPILELGPKIYLPLDGNAQDISGNNNHGTVVGSTQVWGLGLGIDGRSCFSHFLGQWGSIQLPAAAKPTGPFTISVVVCPNNNTTETTRNGLLGGVISGNNSIGLGYAIAARVNGDLSQGFQWQQYPKNQVSPNVAAAICISQDQWGQTVNKLAWMHIMIVIKGNTPADRAMYLNGYKYGNYNATAQYGYVNYNDRDRSWDGNIYLGRCFQTTSSPYDYWMGRITDFALWDRALTDSEIVRVVNKYIGNMIVEPYQSLTMDQLPKTGCFICTGGTGKPNGTNFYDTNNSIKPNGVKATTIEVDMEDITGTYYYLYVNRSLDSSIRGGGITGYTLKVNGTEYIHTMSNLDRLAYNVDGTGTVIGIPKNILKVGSNSIVANLPGFDSQQTVDLVVTQTVKTFNFRLRFVWAGSASPTPIIPNYALRIAGYFRTGGSELIVESTPLANIIGNEITLQDIPDLVAMMWIFDLTNSIQYPLAGSVTVHRTWTTNWPLLFLINNTGSNTTFPNGAESENTIAWENLTESDGKTIILYVNLLSLNQDNSLFQAMRNSSQEDGFRQI